MTTHRLKCGCYSCTEHRRDSARLRKHRDRWALAEVREALGERDGAVGQ